MEILARGLVRDESQIVVEVASADGSHECKLRVAKEDAGRIIGKQGKTIRGLRTLVGAAAELRGERATFELDE